MRNNLYENCYMEQLNVEDTLVNQNYPLSTLYKDVSPFTHFAFVFLVGALDSELTVQLYQDTSATETGSIKVITGATITIAAGDDDETWSIEVESARLDIGNSFRYVTATVTGVAGANDYAAVLFMGWNVKEAPVTQPSTFPSTNSVRIVG